MEEMEETNEDLLKKLTKDLETEETDEDLLKRLTKDLEENEIKKGGSPQYRGRRSSTMVKVPKDVKKWAEYSFKLKKLGFEGALETGWKRAKQLATKEFIPIEDLRYMRNWFARHIITSYPGFKEWNDAGRPKEKRWHKKRAIQSWMTWAGDAGFKWVNSDKTIKLLNEHFGKSYKKIKPL